MSDMIRAWLDHTQQLDKAATAGPWEVDAEGVFARDGTGKDHITSATATGGVWIETPDAEWIAHARTALPAATKAIRAVLDLHEPIHALDYGQPVRGKRLTHVCTGCGQDDGNWNYWPCPTVEAVFRGIGEQ